MQDFITAKREEIAELCRKHHVRRLAIFGSAVRDDFDPARSDVDVLVDFGNSYPEIVHDYREMQTALVRLFGRDVDLIRAGVIRNPYILRRIEHDQEVLYAA